MDAAPPAAGDTDEEAAQRLEQTGRFQVLRTLLPRPVVLRSPTLPNLAVLVDAEITALRHDQDEIIEIGAVSFTYDNDGVIGPAALISLEISLI